MDLQKVETCVFVTMYSTYIINVIVHSSLRANPFLLVHGFHVIKHRN